ncbi:hypothetical protein [Chelatococcus reniformis]|uniref:IclR-ED domain-containing protein n=1 Tax=Chelatococcus reniformis TaxID=1494448 RepID=A0A916XCW8_9HYPH|nr:hypothetical protein [Chelatococcus reniformis]GGC61380.1 hypothetical protein GCM10010994_19930 [Chelatococcus reniformis]
MLKSTHRIRYSAKIGETRPIQVNSMGKALMSLLTPDERRATVAKLSFEMH